MNHDDDNDYILLEDIHDKTTSINASSISILQYSSIHRYGLCINADTTHLFTCTAAQLTDFFTQFQNDIKHESHKIHAGVFLHSSSWKRYSPS